MDATNISPEPGTPPSPVEKASVWEDFLDIFYAPSKVFARRANGNFWIPLLLVTVLIAMLAYANRNIMRPMFDAEFARSTAAAMKANPSLTAAQMERGKAFAFDIAQYGSVVIVPLLVLFVGFVTWIGARFVDAKLSWNAALVVVAYSMVPRVVQQIFVSIEGLFVDPTSLTSRFSMGIGPGRFVDASTVNPFVGALCDRLDLFLLWGLVLIAIGVATIGRLPKAKAWAFGIGLWVVTALPGLYGAIKQM
ncbi:MAG: YIP1 family protein [Gemmatimonadota bacterium]|nr:YIP1 family protein [Gemmatimonadota bacterium]